MGNLWGISNKCREWIKEVRHQGDKGLFLLDDYGLITLRGYDDNFNPVISFIYNGISGENLEVYFI